jgi:dTDP-glucose pyrophosphorylase
LPVGGRVEGSIERPRAVSEYLVERMLRGGATKICFVIGSGKSDILEYYSGDKIGSANAIFVVQPRPGGLCDALFRAAPIAHADEPVLIGLPDTIWFPEDGFRALPEEGLSFLLFPVEQPQFFDAVVTDEKGCVEEIQVKQLNARSSWVWGAFKMPGSIFHQLHRLWLERDQRDEYFGTLVNAWIARGGRATGIRAGEAYVDVGTLHGYRAAIRLLEHMAQPEAIG